MSRQTSRGKATVVQICEAFRVSTQAYYSSKHRPAEAQDGAPRRSRQGPWASASQLDAGIQRVVDGHPDWGVRKVWAYLRREGLIGSRKRIWAIMKAKGLVLPPIRERHETPRRGQVAHRWAQPISMTRSPRGTRNAYIRLNQS